jgi:hypothetical protein
MKTIRHLSLLAFLFLAASNLCLAMQENMDISPERAGELGIVIRSNPNGEDGLKVWLEFAPKGELKNFTHVDLAIGTGGKRLVAAPLFTSRQTPDTVTVFFSADPAWLVTSVLTIVVQDGLRTRIGYQFKVKDFVAKETHR